MKVLFLDIDGVIISSRSHITYSGKTTGKKTGWGLNDADPVALAVLERVANCDVKFVISSTWRLGDSQAALNEVCSILTPTIINQIHPDWRTPVLHKQRGYEIQEWLDKHPETTDYVILDDDSDMLEHQMSHFVKCHCHEGMTFNNIIELYKWSNDPVFGHLGKKNV